MKHVIKEITFRLIEFGGLLIGFILGTLFYHIYLKPILFP